MTEKKYVKGRVLGKGGFAICYEFTDMEKNSILAAKVVAKTSLTKKRALEKVHLSDFSIFIHCNYSTPIFGFSTESRLTSLLIENIASC